MNDKVAERPPNRLTARVLSWGTICAAVVLAFGLALDVAGWADTSGLVGNLGIVALLLTPVAGLAATWWELRRPRPQTAWLAVAVLGVLFLASVVAVLARA